ncbi:hypothetical protein C8J57DRAFT_1507671 [Mycena rebaudengoi]|nr:hypothetical protein C8J57DRAFT_1507671 [Mycena rebaudengoi]
MSLFSLQPHRSLTFTSHPPILLHRLPCPRLLFIAMLLIFSASRTPLFGLKQCSAARKADRDHRYRRDQEALAQARARDLAAAARAARHWNRSISPPPSTAAPRNLATESFPSTPTISTPSDITPSPETPPALLPAVFTPQLIRRLPAPSNPSPTKASTSDDDMAPTKTVDLFRGNGTAEKAHTWLRTLEQTWKWDAEEKEKLYKFEKGLHPGGQAEEWWNGLEAAEKKDWKSLMGAFEKKWAKPKAARRAQDVVIRDLSTNCLDRGSLGQYVDDDDGVSVLSHVAWAEVVRKLLAELQGGDATMLLKGAVRATLPIEFRHLINEAGADTWEKWLTAVEDVEIDRINDAVEERMARHDKMQSDTLSWLIANPNATKAQRDAYHAEFAADLVRSVGINPASYTMSPPASSTRSTASPRGVYVPPAARQSQPPSTPAAEPISRNYQTPSTAVNTTRVPWASRSSTDVFAGSTVRPANAFTKGLMSTPLSPSAGRHTVVSVSGDPARDVELARQVSQNPRLYPADAVGIQRYASDMAAWTSQNGSSPSLDYATFPLTPGTAPPGSRECFRCGVLTNPPHFGTMACKAKNGLEVPMREQNLRKMASGILHPPGLPALAVARGRRAGLGAFAGKETACSSSSSSACSSPSSSPASAPLVPSAGGENIPRSRRTSGASNL